MDRRRFLLTSLAGTVALPSSARAQAPKTYRIGVLYPGANNEIFHGNFAGFRESLSAAGYVEGRNLTFSVQYGEGRPLAPAVAALIKPAPDLVLAVARPGLAAMHASTSAVPVVAIDLESDPVASGFVKTVPRPGGNVTGVFMDFPDLAGKWLEILKGTAPSLMRVAVLWDPATGPAQLDAAERAAAVLGLEMVRAEARTTAELEPAFRAVMRHRPNGMIVLTSPILNSGRRRIAEQAARYRLPTLFPFPGYADDGGLVSYGPDVKTMYEQVGKLAVKVLGGTPPGDIPLERPTRFTLSFNMRTASALGLTIPPSLLLRADHVIE